MALTHDDLQAISSLMDTKLTAALKPIHERLDCMDGRLDRMDERLDRMDGRLDHMDERLNRMDERLNYIEFKQDVMQKKLNDLSIDIKVSERAVRKEINLLKDSQETLITVLESSGILPKIAK